MRPRGRPTAVRLLGFGALLSVGGCGEHAGAGISEPAPPATLACRAGGGAAGCPGPLALDSVRTVAREAIEFASMTAIGHGTVHAGLQTRLVTLVRSIERQDAAGTLRAYADLRQHTDAVETAAAAALAPEWPDVVALRLLIERIGTTLLAPVP